ncbi:hypothetical protein [Corallococcus carmarthensis]|uniref:Uncharacterized protein n=1 Tax=Corallococcus carmarthensis TaxID=2316728 RepID=A0A3A8K6K1_9BACT|nr:hypothetical protein [Corallococcus carmarthensis]NOK16674.1 hypothetical protein [Corallococcus carmarthensis]RKH03700.1 hypothetical protein D7X32_13050 [Corallococcus carmarthensis]
MSQEALRSAPSPSTADEAPTDIPAPMAESFPPLTVLLEEVRSPGMVRADVDALIVGLGRPPAPDEPLRERADLLLALLDRNNAVGDYAGSGGMKVRSAAKEALLALGYPYAMELPVELLETKGAGGKESGLSGGDVVLAVVSLLYQSVALLGARLILTNFNLNADEVTLGIGAGIWLFTLAALAGHQGRSRDLQVVGSVGLWVVTVFWGLMALLGSAAVGVGALALIPWHLALWTAISLRPEPEPEALPAKPSSPPTP